MRLRLLRYSVTVGAIAMLLAFGACRLNRNYGFKVEVKAGASRDEKVALAKVALGDENASAVRKAIGERFPDLTETQVAGIGFGIQVWNSPKKDGSARVYIAIQGLYGQGFDPQPVVLSAAEILEEKLRVASAPQAGS